MQGTAEFHHEITDTLFPQAAPVFDDAAALDTTVDMLDPQPTLVERLVGVCSGYVYISCMAYARILTKPLVGPAGGNVRW